MAKESVIFMVGTNPNDPAQEEEFNRWYTHTHIPEVCRIPGVNKATRYQALQPAEGYPKFVAIYEMDGEEGLASFTDHTRRQRKGELPSFTPGPPFQVVWRLAYKKLGP